MWQRFTERARRVVFYAQEEAGKFGADEVSTEHLLLGLVSEGDSVAARVLDRMGVTLGQIRSEVERRVSKKDVRLGQDMRLAAGGKRVIDLAYEEARYLGNDYVGTEHLLLGLLAEREGIGACVLRALGADLPRARCEVRKLQIAELSGGGSQVATVCDPGGDGGMKSVLHGVNNVHVLRGRSLVSVADLTAGEIDLVFSVARLLKETRKNNRTAHLSILAGRTLAMVFEKPSLRTRVTFEAGMTQLGGHAIYLAPADIQLGARETVPDAARNLSRWCDCIMARVFAHTRVMELAENASVPVINGLSDLEHPCQALADFQTIKEKKREFAGLKLAFIGDGNNVVNSLMLLAAKVGTSFVIACPEGYEPDAGVVREARSIASETGAAIEIVRDPREAAGGADALYTDVWASMGQEAEREERKKVFASYQVNRELLKVAKPDAIVLHCLPAHRGEEITDEVLDGPQSVVLDEAENRLHVQKAILALVV